MQNGKDDPNGSVPDVFVTNVDVNHFDMLVNVVVTDDGMVLNVLTLAQDVVHHTAVTISVSDDVAVLDINSGNSYQVNNVGLHV